MIRLEIVGQNNDKNSSRPSLAARPPLYAVVLLVRTSPWT